MRQIKRNLNATEGRRFRGMLCQTKINQHLVKLLNVQIWDVCLKSYVIQLFGTGTTLPAK